MSVNSATRRPGELARAGVNDIFAGLVASVITIAYGLSFAALIFSAKHLVAATFITARDGDRPARTRVTPARPDHCRGTATLVSAWCTPTATCRRIFWPANHEISGHDLLIGSLRLANRLYERSRVRSPAAETSSWCSTSAWSPALIGDSTALIKRPPTNSARLLVLVNLSSPFRNRTHRRRRDPR